MEEQGTRIPWLITRFVLHLTPAFSLIGSEDQRATHGGSDTPTEAIRVGRCIPIDWIPSGFWRYPNYINVWVEENMGG